MSAAREALIRATVAHSLGMSDTEEQPVDRVMALGFGARRGELTADRIGSLVLRAMAHDESARAEVVGLIARCIRPRAVNISASRVAAAVLDEIVNSNCPVCGGRKMVFGAHSAAKVCCACNGTGKKDTRRYGARVGGKAIPEDLYTLAYNLYADGLNTAQARARRVLG